MQLLCNMSCETRERMQNMFRNNLISVHLHCTSRLPTLAHAPSYAPYPQPPSGQPSDGAVPVRGLTGPPPPQGSIALPHSGPSRAGPLRRHQTCDFREHATSAPAEPGGEIRNVSRNQAHTHVLWQALKSHVFGSGTFGAFWPAQHCICASPLFTFALPRRARAAAGCRGLPRTLGAPRPVPLLTAV